MVIRLIVSGLLIFFIHAASVFAHSDINLLSLPEKDFGVQDATKVLRENDSLTVYGIRALAAARVPVDTIQHRYFSLIANSSSDSTGFLFWGKGSQVTLHPFVVEKGEEPKEYTFDLWTFPDFQGSFAVFGFGFQHPLGEEQRVTISRMMIQEEGPSSFINGLKQFFVPEYITFPSINFFWGPRLWQKSFNFWILMMFIIVSITFFSRFVFGRDVSWRRAGAAVFTIAAISWMVFDARNILNLFAIAHKDIEGLVASPRYEKTYDDMLDLYGFLHFVEDNVPQNSSLVFFSSFGTVHQLRAEYVLRPREITLGIPENVPLRDFLVLYRYPARIDEEKKTIAMGELIVPYKEIIAFRENSFIVKIK